MTVTHVDTDISMTWPADSPAYPRSQHFQRQAMINGLTMTLLDMGITP
jgi:hypothetical protein